MSRLVIFFIKEFKLKHDIIVKKTTSSLLDKFGLHKKDIRHWIIHPGGKNILGNIKNSLQLSENDVELSRYVLRNYGNMSSPTVLFVLDEIINGGKTQTGDYGVMLTLGPGLACEAALLKW